MHSWKNGKRVEISARTGPSVRFLLRESGMLTGEIKVQFDAIRLGAQGKRSGSKGGGRLAVPTADIEGRNNHEASSKKDRQA